MLTLEEAICCYEEDAKKCDNRVNEIILGAERCKQDKEKYTQLAAWLRELQRARVLLKATHDLLEAADDSPYVEDALGIIVHYDDADCEGRCLMEDIEYHFDEFGEERSADAED